MEEGTNPSGTNPDDPDDDAIEKDIIELLLDDYFEPYFFMARYVIIVPVVVSFLGAVLSFGIGTYFTYEGFVELYHHGTAKVSLHVIKAVDAYLLGLILVIFSFGVYDFFVSELEPAEEAGVRPDWLKFETVGELKNKVVEVVIVILAILFYEQMKAHGGSFSTFKEFLIIPIGTMLLAIAVGSFKFLTE
ncbi:MAG: YqhA family protein [Halococcoides sp.]